MQHKQNKSFSFVIVWVDGETSSKLPRSRQIAAGFCPRGDPRSSTDSNSIKVPFICRGGPSNRQGREREAEKASRFAQQLRGPTFAGSCMDSPSVPPLLPFSPPPPPPVHTCSHLQQMFEVNLPPLFHLLLVTQAKRRRIKKTHKSFPWLPSGLPGQESGRENSGKKNRGGKGWWGRGGKGGGLKNIYILF